MARSFVLLFALACLASACQPAPVVGAACMYPADCRQPLRCRFGRCRNECTLNADCPLGTTCLVDSRGDGFCGVPQDEGCTRGIPCDVALVCALDRCLDPCADSSACPDDGVCALGSAGVRACFDVRELPDASVPDAQSPDAEVRDAP